MLHIERIWENSNFNAENKFFFWIKQLPLVCHFHYLSLSNNILNLSSAPFSKENITFRAVVVTFYRSPLRFSCLVLFCFLGFSWHGVSPNKDLLSLRDVGMRTQLILVCSLTMITHAGIEEIIK